MPPVYEKVCFPVLHAEVCLAYLHILKASACSSVPAEMLLLVVNCCLVLVQILSCFALGLGYPEGFFKEV